jgi:hypothetical protein
MDVEADVVVEGLRESHIIAMNDGHDKQQHVT